MSRFIEDMRAKALKLKEEIAKFFENKKQREQHEALAKIAEMCSDLALIELEDFDMTDIYDAMELIEDVYNDNKKDIEKAKSVN